IAAFPGGRNLYLAQRHLRVATYFNRNAPSLFEPGQVFTELVKNLKSSRRIQEHLYTAHIRVAQLALDLSQHLQPKRFGRLHMPGPRAMRTAVEQRLAQAVPDALPRHLDHTQRTDRKH